MSAVSRIFDRSAFAACLSAFRRLMVPSLFLLTVVIPLANPAASSAASAVPGGVYVADSGSYGQASLSEFGVGSGGGLSALSPAVVGGGPQPFGVVVSPNGKNVYVSDQSSVQVSQYSVNSGTGVASPMSPATVPADGAPEGIAISPDGTSVYVANWGTNSVSQYSVNSVTGALSPKSPATVPTGPNPMDVVVSPDGRSVYVTDYRGTEVSLYSVDQTTGKLSPQSPATVSAGDNPEGIAVSPNGRSVYVVDIGDNAVSQYSVSSTGGLSPMSPAAVATGSEPIGVSVSPDGSSAYVADFGSNSVSQYSVSSSSGGLSPKSPATIAAGNGPVAVAEAPDSSSVYVTDELANAVSQYSVAAGTGTLSAQSPATVATGSAPVGIAVRSVPGSGQPPSPSVDPTATSLTCVATAIPVNQATNCTATVTDTASSPTTPSGTVSFASDSPGGFTGSPCTLAGSGATATCQVSYTATSVATGTHTITATYSGDSTHTTSTQTQTLTINPLPTTSPFTDTTTGIHLGLMYDYSATNPSLVASDVDYIFGGYFLNWNFGFYPPVAHNDGYVQFDLDNYPQTDTGHSLAWWQANHPDWIVYQCDGTTPAYYGSGNTDVPLDFSNPAVRAWQVQNEVAPLVAAGATGIAFDNFTFANFTGACGVYKNGVWTSLGYPGVWQDNAKLNSDMLGWLQDMQSRMAQQFPKVTVDMNFTTLTSGLSTLEQVAPYLSLDTDEAGFTDYGGEYGGGNLSDTAWQQEVDGLEYLNGLGKAWFAVGAVDASGDQNVTHTQLNWVLGNYLLVKGAHSYTYVYAANSGGPTGSPSGYGTFYDRPEYHIPIGSPTSGRYQAQSVQMRNYSGGLVIVNPSSSQTYTVTLSGTYQDMWGQSMTSVTLSPTTAIVLLNSSVVSVHRVAATPRHASSARGATVPRPARRRPTRRHRRARPRRPTGPR